MDDRIEELLRKREAGELEKLDSEAEAPTPEEIPETIGDIRIADEVICIVAALAAKEIPGVLGTNGDFIDDIGTFFGTDTNSKGVRLKYEGKLVNISIHLIIEYGYCIPEIALVVQEKVKSAVEEMTGYEVQFVDVHIEGVQKRKQSQLEREFGSDETMADIINEQEKHAAATVTTSFEMQLANLKNDDFDDPAEDESDDAKKDFSEEE